MNVQKGRIACVLLVLFWSSIAWGYETPTHWRLSGVAFNASNLSNASVRRNIGIDKIYEIQMFTASHKKLANDLLLVSPSCDPKAIMKLRQLLVCGAMYEDIPGTRSLSHFFDPISGESLSIDGSKPWAALGLTSLTSPDWSLQDTNDSAEQQFSYRRARTYFARALLSLGPASVVNGRNHQWGLLFQSLGHVIHHVQDMAQPQHTRNDPHTDLFNPLFGSTGFGKYRHPSRYERYSINDRGAAKIDQAILQDLVPVFPAYANHFKQPRDFWTGSPRGLADYSNFNFLSHGTNFTADINGNLLVNTKFSSPVPTGATTLTVAAAFAPDPVPPSIAKLCEGVDAADCNMTFYANRWSDPLSNTPQTNPRASTESIFDEDLKLRSISYSWDDGRVTTSRMFALNQLNFDAAYPFLIPRAVAYSAGLINYFFRGQMEIALPDDGVYALVDHQAQRCKDSCGFGKVKLKITNTTPGEDMGAGTLRAVVKFHRNNCYRDDLSGDPGGSAFSGLSCRSQQEEVVVSDALALQSLRTLEQRELTFLFPTAIPINASDLYLQVVFQGKLGEEVDAVAVTTRDIAEPNYVAFTNVTDKAYDFADHAFHALPYRIYTVPDSVYGITVAFREGANSIAQIGQLNAPGHAQMAFLADPGQQYLDIRYSSQRYTVSSPLQGTIPVSEFTGVPDLWTYGRTVNFTGARGVFRDFELSHRLPPDFTVHDCIAEPELCAQSTLTPFTPTSAVQWTISF
jgi:hypothetical protein